MKQESVYRCSFCRRTLTDPQSIALGIGPECAAKKSRIYSAAGTSEAEMARIADFDDRAARMIRNALRIAGSRDIEWAQRRLAKVRSEIMIAIAA